MGLDWGTPCPSSPPLAFPPACFRNPAFREIRCGSCKPCFIEASYEIAPAGTPASLRLYGLTVQLYGITVQRSPHRQLLP